MKQEGARDRPGDPKKAEKRREQNRLAKKRSREKKKHDQVRNEGKAEEEKEREEVYQFARIWRYIDQQDGMLDQQDGIISEQEAVIAELKSQAAQWKSQAAQWQRQNMRLDELCDSYHKELCDYLRETNERKSGSIQEPVQVSHSELLNKAQISPIHQRTCPPLPPEDGRFDPTSCTSIDASWRDLVVLSGPKQTIFWPICPSW